MNAVLPRWQQTGSTIPARRFLLAATAALLGSHVSPVQAEDAPLARSSSHKIDIYGDGGAAWCRPAVGLRLVIEPGSPDAATPPEALVPMMNRLSAMIASRCPAATSADLGVLREGTVVKRFHAEQAHGWAFAAVTPPVVAPMATDLDTVTPKPPAPLPAPAPIPLPPAQAAVLAPASPVPVASLPTAPLPLENFSGLMLRLAHDAPDILASDDVATWWASGHEREALSKSRNDDFAMHTLLQQARGEMRAAIASHDLSIVHVSTQAEFGTYDFSSGRFPLPVEGTELSLRDPLCCFGPKMPYSIALHADGIDAVDGFKLDQNQASAFVNRRKTRWGGSNRTVYIDYVMKLADGPMKTIGYQQAYQGTVIGATIYDDQAHQTVLGVIDQALIQQRLQAAAAAKLAEDQKAADAARQQRVAMLSQQRQTYVQMAQGWPQERRIPFLLASDSLYGSDTLEDVRSLRVAALLAAKPVPATLLFQADGDGAKGVATQWPGKLTVDVPAAGTALKTGRWYVAKGNVSVPEPDKSADTPVSDATFMVSELHACTRDRCAESDDITAMVDAKITDQGATP